MVLLDPLQPWPSLISPPCNSAWPPSGPFSRAASALRSPCQHPSSCGHQAWVLRVLVPDTPFLLHSSPSRGFTCHLVPAHCRYLFRLHLSLWSRDPKFQLLERALSGMFWNEDTVLSLSQGLRVPCCGFQTVGLVCPPVGCAWGQGGGEAKGRFGCRGHNGGQFSKIS